MANRKGQRTRDDLGVAYSLPFALLFLLSLAACRDANPDNTFHFSQFAMDTVVEYTIVAPSHEDARAAMEHAHAEMERVAQLLWEEDSLSQIYAFNHAAGTITLNPEAGDFLRRTVAYYEASGGAFDPTVKPVLDLYDFLAESPTPPSSAAIRERLPRVGMEALSFDATTPHTFSPGRLTLAVGGVAKGYAVDRAVQVLREHGIAHAIVNAGGDLYCLGAHNGRPWVVGIRHPDDPAAILDTLYLSNRAVATSGDYQRFFTHEGVRYHHLLDPRTGQPARRSRSATVIAPTTEQADAMATALFVAGPDTGIALLDSLPNVEGMVIDSLAQMHASRQYHSVSRREGTN